MKKAADYTIERLTSVTAWFTFPDETADFENLPGLIDQMANTKRYYDLDMEWNWGGGCADPQITVSGRSESRVRRCVETFIRRAIRIKGVTVVR